jgi:hypothetical protein
MTEDRGAFKTKPRNWAGFPQFVITRERRGGDATGSEKRPSDRIDQTLARLF